MVNSYKEGRKLFGWSCAFGPINWCVVITLIACRWRGISYGSFCDRALIMSSLVRRHECWIQKGGPAMTSAKSGLVQVDVRGWVESGK